MRKNRWLPEKALTGAYPAGNSYLINYIRELYTWLTVPKWMSGLFILGLFC